jgi:hypothetical protein
VRRKSSAEGRAEAQERQQQQQQQQQQMMMMMMMMMTMMTMMIFWGGRSYVDAEAQACCTAKSSPVFRYLMAGICMCDWCLSDTCGIGQTPITHADACHQVTSVLGTARLGSCNS